LKKDGSRLEDVGPWLKLNMAPLLPVQLHALISDFGSPVEVLEASYEAIGKSLGIKEDRARDLIEKIRRIDVDKEIEEIGIRGIKIVTYMDSTYPSCLKAIFDPPLVLYILGKFPFPDKNNLAIVGSRQATLYGRLMANSLAKEIAGFGVSIVSGMARGIDTAAHRGALEGGGWTIAVLGSGLDIVYPAENAWLMKEIVASGTVISEFPLGTRPLRQNFPRRNRIIAGLSMGVVVIEATRRSGALITTEYALENGREVFAVPGRIDSRYSEGTNSLIKQGAKLVTNVRDILEEFSHISPLDEEPSNKKGEKNLRVTLEGDELRVFEFLDFEPRHIEAIIHDLGIPVQRVVTALTGLEIKELARQLQGKMFIKKNRWA